MNGAQTTALDAHFLDLLRRRCGAPGDEVAAAIGALLGASAEGHVHLPLARLAAASGGTAVETWRRALLDYPAVGRPGEARPLVLDERDRLYLHRFWLNEQVLAARLGALAAARRDPPPGVAERLGEVFEPGPGGDQRQRIAAALALSRALAVISGGPGTGKTATAVRVLGLLEELRPGVRIALAAPTGKAAARLEESARAAAVAAGARATTLHRLLGIRGGGGRPWRHRGRPLDCDLVVVDEASMVDLEIITRLADALPEHAGLMLLGDRDQLASVEAGAVLGDLCARARGPSGPWREELAAIAGCPVPGDDEPQPPIGECIALLEVNRRFAPDSAIARFAAHVRSGDADAAVAVLAGGDDALQWHRDRSRGALAAHIVDGYRPLVEAARAGADPASLIARLDGWRVLCAHRRGLDGAEHLAARAESMLGGVGGGARRSFAGRAVMVTRNDPSLDLWNGDIGVERHRDHGAVEVCFAGSGGELRRIAAARLPAHESAFVTTVHKAQGSECDRAMLVLPGEPSAVLTRELLYTAVTRARVGVEIWGDEAVLRAAITRRVERASGLSDALWGGPS